jgi:hypothetical protein
VGLQGVPGSILQGGSLFILGNQALEIEASSSKSFNKDVVVYGMKFLTFFPCQSLDQGVLFKQTQTRRAEKTRGREVGSP